MSSSSQQFPIHFSSYDGFLKNVEQCRLLFVRTRVVTDVDAKPPAAAAHGHMGTSKNLGHQQFKCATFPYCHSYHDSYRYGAVPDCGTTGFQELDEDS